MVVRSTVNFVKVQQQSVQRVLCTLSTDVIVVRLLDLLLDGMWYAGFRDAYSKLVMAVRVVIASLSSLCTADMWMAKWTLPRSGPHSQSS